MKQLVEFRINDGDREYAEFGIYDKKYSDVRIIEDFFSIENMREDYDYKDNYWWYDNKLVSVVNRVDIDDDKIKIMKDYGVAYEHSI